MQKYVNIVRVLNEFGLAIFGSVRCLCHHSAHDLHDTCTRRRSSGLSGPSRTKCRSQQTMIFNPRRCKDLQKSQGPGSSEIPVGLWIP